MKPNDITDVLDKMAKELEGKREQLTAKYNSLAHHLSSEDQGLINGILQSAKTGTVNSELVDKLLEKHKK